MKLLLRQWYDKYAVNKSRDVDLCWFFIIEVILCDNDFVVCIENCILFSLIKINNSALFKFNYEIIVQFKKEEEDTVYDKMII